MHLLKSSCRNSMDCKFKNIYDMGVLKFVNLPIIA